jgi:hypothetical protein
MTGSAELSKRLLGSGPVADPITKEEPLSLVSKREASHPTNHARKAFDRGLAGLNRQSGGE